MVEMYASGFLLLTQFVYWFDLILFILHFFNGPSEGYAFQPHHKSIILFLMFTLFTLHCLKRMIPLALQAKHSGHYL
jgi:hypothetical protein